MDQGADQGGEGQENDGAQEQDRYPLRAMRSGCEKAGARGGLHGQTSAVVEMLPLAR
ncbi:unnamed protein product [Scytosiphon promiscuus]